MVQINQMRIPFLLFLLAIVPIGVFAHPGNTASDGCHYCRTNCASWGEVYGARHCHGGGYIAPARTYTPPSTQKTETTAAPSTETKSNFNPEDYYAPAVVTTPEEEDDGWWLVWLFIIGGGGFFLINRMRRGKQIKEQEDRILEEERRDGDTKKISTPLHNYNSYDNHDTFPDSSEFVNHDYDDEVVGIMQRNDLEYDDATEVQEIMNDWGVDEDDAIMIKEEL